ncbi:MAG: hypothetical protein OCD76_09110 [Reichenbachiella sp.]
MKRDKLTYLAMNSVIQWGRMSDGGYWWSDGGGRTEYYCFLSLRIVGRNAYSYLKEPAEG